MIKVKKPTHMTDLHFEHKSWNSELLFQRDELGNFGKRLDRLVTKNTDKDILAAAQKFQNMIIEQNDTVDSFLQDINAHEHMLSHFAQEHPVGVDHVHFTDHNALRNKIETQRKLFSEFKKKYFSFLTDVM